eukprot:1364305-Ditylum_brightwellii.AAC.1
MSLAIIAPVVVKFKCCNAMGFIRCCAVVLNDAGLLYLFLLVDLAKFMEESGVGAFVDSKVGSMK